MKGSLKWLISLLHAALLAALTIFWMNTGFTTGDEHQFVKWSSAFRHLFLGIDKHPAKKDFIFINLAYDKALIAREDGPGHEVITDRKKLSEFFEVLKRHQQEVKFSFCDVFIKGNSVDDSLLQASVRGIRNLVFPTHFDQNGYIEKLPMELPIALADYRSSDGSFLKFKLFQSDSLATLPVYLYEHLSGRQFKKEGWTYRDSGQMSLSTIIIDYQIRAHQLFEQNEYPVVGLSELMALPERVIVNDFLKDRIIVMGDLSQDIHETVFGPMPGSLILLNVFLSLMDGRHLIGFWFIFVLITGFSIFSRIMLFPPASEGIEGKRPWFKPLLGSIFLLWLFSGLFYFIFNQHLQVFFTVLYINSLRYLIQQKKDNWPVMDIKFKI